MRKTSNILLLRLETQSIQCIINQYLSYSFLLLIILLASLFTTSKTHAGLTQEEIEDFHKNKGYVIVRKMYNPKEIQEISECSDRLEKEAEELGKSLSEGIQHKIMHNGTQFVLENVKGETSIHRIVWVGAAEPVLLKEGPKYGQKKELLECVGQLLGKQEGVHLINQLHYKRPGKDAKVEFVPHQDIENRIIFDSDWKDINGTGSFVQTLITRIMD